MILFRGWYALHSRYLIESSNFYGLFIKSVLHSIPSMAQNTVMPSMAQNTVRIFSLSLAWKAEKHKLTKQTHTRKPDKKSSAIEKQSNGVASVTDNMFICTRANLRADRGLFDGLTHVSSTVTCSVPPKFNVCQVHCRSNGILSSAWLHVKSSACSTFSRHFEWYIYRGSEMIKLRYLAV